MKSGDVVLCIVTTQRYIVEKVCGRTIRLAREHGGWKSTWRKTTFENHFKLEDN